MPIDTILAVDDDEPILALYRRIFRPPEPGALDILGFGTEAPSLPPLDCRTYSDPLLLLADYKREYAKGLRARVCILDILMPQQNGLVTARQLREIDPDIEIVVCTADPGTVPLAVSEELGSGVFFVRKPPHSDEFALMVHALVRSWNERRKLQRRTLMLRRRAETMRKQAAFLGSLLEAVPELIFMKDIEGVFIMCNRMFARYAGRAPADIIGGTECAFLTKERCQVYLAQDRQVMQGGTPLTFREEVQGPDGAPCLLETVKSPVYSANGECIGLIGIARDITNRGPK